MFDLTGMTALVTGASGGIGSAIARALAGQGARLAVSGSNVEKLEAFRASLGGDHVALPCDLSDAAAVDALVPQAVEALGGRRENSSQLDLGKFLDLVKGLTIRLLTPMRLEPALEDVVGPQPYRGSDVQTLTNIVEALNEGLGERSRGAEEPEGEVKG